MGIYHFFRRQKCSKQYFIINILQALYLKVQVPSLIIKQHTLSLFFFFFFAKISCIPWWSHLIRKLLTQQQLFCCWRDKFLNRHRRDRQKTLEKYFQWRWMCKDVSKWLLIKYSCSSKWAWVMSDIKIHAYTWTFSHLRNASSIPVTFIQLITWL